jgi:hypothetical protein
LLHCQTVYMRKPIRTQCDKPLQLLSGWWGSSGNLCCHRYSGCGCCRRGRGTRCQRCSGWGGRGTSGKLLLLRLRLRLRLWLLPAWALAWGLMGCSCRFRALALVSRRRGFDVLPL